MEPKLTDLADLAPSGDFALNAFLLELNDDLTDEDLEKLKFLCKGINSIMRFSYFFLIKSCVLLCCTWLMLD